MTTYTCTYATTAAVASQLRLKDPSTGNRLVFSSSTDPTADEVSQWINEAEEYIDRETNHSWKETFVTNEYHDWLGNYDQIWRRQAVIPLNHRAIRTLAATTATTTDKVEVYSTDGYTDILASGSGYSCGEAETDDFRMDYTNGILFLKTNVPLYYATNAVRVSYRYGESSVPYDIREACIKLVAIRYLESEFYTTTIPNGPGLAPSKESIITRWKADVDRILERRREFKINSL